MEVESGKKLEDEIKHIKYSGIAWTHDELGFFYSRFPLSDDKKTSSEESNHKVNSSFLPSPSLFLLNYYLSLFE